MITLFDYELSSDCYQARLALAVLGLHYSRVDVEFYPGREHETEWFTELSPLQQLPVLRDEHTTLYDAQAILVYLAARHDATGTWLPRRDPVLVGEVTQWLGLSRALASSAGAARLHESLGHVTDVTAARARAHTLLRTLDEHLWFGEQEGRSWLCAADHPTIADLAVFPDVALSEEGGVSRIDYPAVRRWTDRVKRIDGFVPRSGLFPGGSAAAPWPR
ncbi:glutathione S-transferase family protein [Nocardioides antri]|uniref:Glutathione S-transferase family protein n=1 Tax=Nocardioides antri TaxID=2607659 RepID=A0A5B1M1R0_9ACTN|nr:glutathione S-transferase [Nocardioides antri]KAA1426586.1 glutathione S-transferase family protein [Nocardioides antri]